MSELHSTQPAPPDDDAEGPECEPSDTARPFPVTLSGASLSAEMLASAMRDLKVSRRALARRLGVSKGVVDAWLDGRRPMPFYALAFMPPTLASALLRRMQARIDGATYRRSNMPPSMMANIASVSLADFTRSVVEAESDGVVSAEERAGCAQKLEHHIGVATTQWQELRS